MVTHHRPGPDEGFADAVDRLLDVLSRAAGFSHASVARSADDVDEWLLIVRWADAGSMRRGLGGYEAKIALAPVMTSVVGRHGAFEVLAEVDPSGRATHSSDRAPEDAGRP